MGNLNLSRRLVSQEDASVVARPDVPRSKFVGSWTRKTTFDAGWLVPFLVDEVLPGDHLKYDVTAYVRMATPIFPLMDNLRVDTFFFFVPNRLVWSNWRQFMGQQANPSDSIDFVIPTLEFAETSTINAAGTLADYFGLPVNNLAALQAINVNALPFRAYRLIYNEWFRDQNLINSATVPTGNETGGAMTASNYPLYRRAKSHDYFTSALPWPQKFTAPNIGAPVSGIGFSATTGLVAAPSLAYESEVGNVAPAFAYGVPSTGDIYLEADSVSNPLVVANLGINEFREAMLIQQLLERDARGGTRYTEILKNHFGVTSPDARLQRPEFLGGGSSPLNITPIAQTATGGAGVGALGAAGTAVGGHRASVAATEHGYVIGIINVKSELSYYQGLHKMWSRQTRYDFYWPSLAGLGEQAILRQELFCTGTDANDEAVFGYQERWHEYRTRTSEVTGHFRSNYATPIDQWHLSQVLSTPVLNQTFIEDRPPIARVIGAGSAADGQQFLGDILIKREAVRPIPMYGTPVTLGRF